MTHQSVNQSEKEEEHQLIFIYFGYLLVKICVAKKIFYVSYLSVAENKNISFYVILYVRGVGKIIIKCKIKKKLCSFPLCSNLCYLSCHLISPLPPHRLSYC